MVIITITKEKDNFIIYQNANTKKEFNSHFKINYNFYSTLSPLEEKEYKEDNYTRTNLDNFNEFEL